MRPTKQLLIIALLLLTSSLFWQAGAFTNESGIRADFYQNPRDSSFLLIDDFEKNVLTFNSDTFSLAGHSTQGGEVIVYHTNKRKYLVFDIWLFGEMGKVHSRYWVGRDEAPDFKIIKRTDYVYDRPFYEKGFTVKETTEYYSFNGKLFKRYDVRRNEVRDSLNDQKRDQAISFFNDMTKDIKIVK